MASLLTSQTTSEALGAKNDALLAETRAADAYNGYEARVIREHFTEGELEAHPRLSAAARERLAAAAAADRSAQAPLEQKARDLERSVDDQLARAEHARFVHRYFEGSATALEIAIAVVSVAALTGARALAVLGSACALAGFASLCYGIAVR